MGDAIFIQIFSKKRKLKTSAPIKYKTHKSLLKEFMGFIFN